MYITYDDVVVRYPVLEGWGKSDTEVNSDLIYYAEMKLNGLFAPAFSVPFSASHPTVKDLAIDLTYHKALATRDPKMATAVNSAVLGRIQNIIDGKEYIYTGSGTTIAPDDAQGGVWVSDVNSQAWDSYHNPDASVEGTFVNSYD